MEKKSQTRSIRAILLLASCLFLCSCEKDSFNPDKVKATYKDKFPVENIDPNMDWKMTNQVTVDISVFEDYGVDYTVEIFDNNPYSTDPKPHLLAKGIANQTLSFRTVTDCPTTLSTLFVSRLDEAGRRVFKPVSISNNKVSTSFGSKSLTRSLSALTRSGDEFEISQVTRPYTDSEIESLLAQAVEYTGQDMDTDIANTKVFKVSGNYKGVINHGGSLTPDRSTLKLIIAPDATWTISSPIVVNQGLEIIVANKGKIDLKAGSQNSPSLKFTNSSSLTVLGTGYQEDDSSGDNGTITGHGWIEFSNGGTNYNSGIINADGIVNNGGTFYNYGEITTKEVQGSSTGSIFVNHGNLSTSKVGNNNTGPQIATSCKVEISGEYISTGITLGKAAYIKCKKLTASGFINLSDNSMIVVDGDVFLSNCNITGPTADNSYALLKFGAIQNANWIGTWGVEVTEGYVINNIYCEFSRVEWNGNWNFVNCCLNGLAGGNGLKGNGNAVLCNAGQAPAYIPEGRCTGDGNTPGDGDGEGEPELLPYTYVFEDNFPLVGDYDFNDVVLDVYITHDRGNDNKITATNIDITLAAAGATKTLSGVLRLVDINKAAIANISYSGDVSQFQNTLAGSLVERINDDLVIPLFGNAHNVFGVEPGVFINTGAKTGVTLPTYTYKVKIELNNAYQSENPVVSKDNLDFFIAYQYKSMQQRMEVHLYEFWKYGATPGGTVQKENLDLAGNNTWAICVPNFRYPKEFVNISTTSGECAYPLFLQWAQNRTSETEGWHLQPNENYVYR